jgi:hypothetical protein
MESNIAEVRDRGVRDIKTSYSYNSKLFNRVLITWAIVVNGDVETDLYDGYS